MTESTMVQEPETEIIQAEDSVIEVPVYPVETTDCKPRKKHAFWKVLTVYFALFIVLATVGLWFFYNYLKAFESATPTSALNTYIQWITDRDYEAIYETSDFEETILNTKDEFIKYLERLYKGDVSTLTAREKSGSSEERREYSLYIEGERVCGLTLLKNPEWGETAWNYVTEIQYQPTTSIYASDDMRITVNGVDLSLLNLPSTPAQTTVLGGADDAEALPPVSCYTVERLLNPPMIEALTLSGEACTVTKTEEASYHIFRPAVDALQAEHEELAKKTAFKYAEFVARDATRAELLKFVYKDSALYDTIWNFSNHWFTGHDSYKFNDVTISAYTQYTASDFSCEVSFQPVYTRKKHVIESTPFHCRLTFVLVNEEWKLLALTQIVTETESPDSTATTTETTTTATTGTTVSQG